VVRIIEAITLSAVSVHTIVALICDLRTRRIPNKWNLAAAIGGIGFHLITGGLAGFQYAMLSMGVMLAIPLVLQLCGAIGGGDVKWFAALGAWSGLAFGLAVFMLTMIIAALIGMGILIGQGQLWGRLRAWFTALLFAVLYRNPAHLGVSREQAALEMPLMIAVVPAVIAAYFRVNGGMYL